VCMSKYQIPPLSTLKAFEAAARLKSISKAGDELHVSHSAVSRHIKNLERHLGHRLFERHYRRIALTADGEIFLAGVTAGLSQIERAVMQLRGSQRAKKLVISVDPDFAGLWLVPRLTELYAIVPNTLVEILAEKSANSLHDHRSDCAVHYAEAGTDLENGEVLFRSRLFPVCAPGLTKVLPLRSPEDLKFHTLLHDRSFVEWEEYLQSCSMMINVNGGNAIFSTTALCLEAAVRGQGVAIGDDFLGAMYLSEGRLVRPFDSALHSRNAYYFIAPKRSARHPAVTAFRHWLFQSIRRHRNAQRPRSGWA
jgi:LysR family transcriptional regulator, glycine cleavage system transcriptional activator